MRNGYTKNFIQTESLFLRAPRDVSPQEEYGKYMLRYFEVFDIINFVIFKTSQKSKSIEKLFVVITK